ncbi:sulfate/molybdate ABC transporter ATP-binding protein [Gluconacetobacter tumulicola]|uniref:Sulfate/molybdate ABC transporter ATP-binding protein n=1 Tax=Gluconacetobacter tumulicola TaxID=1017177 RepID=A0A7W4JF91_9PROT|nr:sulfate/molybdate ABC transporter ATP-binding protein [Gluconacetobacter tumulicola]MBB2180004.1 sulfate/molybdate ABC transporter ATP-binding protein [Gluconacetobacter tumulicola]
MSVQIQSLTRRAPNASRKMLDGVSLTIEDGAFVALVGPSGAGKTTLLRTIAGLDGPYEGTVLVDGQVLAGRPMRERRIGFVFQNYALFRHMTVARNISFGLDVLPRGERPDRGAIAARVAELLELIQLPTLGGAYPDQLSGGQRQRVALARALATKPGLLLLDEPFGALDPIVRRQIRRWLRGLHDQLGLTTVLVTHDHDEALEVADRLVVMQNGRIVQEAAAETLDAAPATPFVMEFLGEALEFAGRVAHGRFLPDDPNVLSFAVSAGDGPATAYLRPHEARLVAAGGAARAIPLTGGQGGLRRLAVALGTREVEILVLPERLGQAGTEGLGLDIGRARLFRDGAPLAGAPPVASGQELPRVTVG